MRAGLTLRKIACVILLPAAWSLAQDTGVVYERIFGPGTPTGPYKHPASITELNDGDIYLVYYGGAGAYATDTAVYGARLAKGAGK